jgi:hypothetical protein
MHLLRGYIHVSTLTADNSSTSESIDSRVLATYHVPCVACKHSPRLANHTRRSQPQHQHPRRYRLPNSHIHIQGEMTLRTESASRDTVCSQWNTGRTTGGQLTATNAGICKCVGREPFPTTSQTNAGLATRRILLYDGLLVRVVWVCVRR